jgi:PAS domain S-box-containing protein
MASDSVLPSPLLVPFTPALVEWAVRLWSAVCGRQELDARRYRALLEAAPDAMVVVDQRGEIVLLNVQAETQFGYSPNELVGQQVSRIIPEGFEERLSVDEARAAAGALAQRMGTGLDLIGRRRDGSEFPLEIMLSALETSEGVLVTAAIRDISVRRAADQHLVQMERRYRGLLEAAPDGIVVVNEHEHIVLLNARAETDFGYHRDELVGRPVTTIIPEGFAEQLRAECLPSADAAPTHRRAVKELIGSRKDASQFPIEITLSPLATPEGVLVTAAVRDITARRAAEEHLVKTVAALKRSNEELAQFAYVASHDLQEPLRMVASYTQLLATRYKGRLDTDADDFIACAVDGSTRMQQLIRDLLTYSRAGTDQPLRALASTQALDDALENLRATILESHAVVTHDGLPTLTTDVTVLTHVLQNLIGNAIKYRGPDLPRVHVSASCGQGRDWTFAVRDNGLGIEARHLERIFLLFQRLHPRSEFEGTGIGLALCRKMVDRVGGRIWAESEPGRGSTFFFSLPDGEAP